MTSRLRKKPPTTALTFLASFLSSSVVAISLFTGGTALSQSPPHSQPSDRAVGNPSWTAKRSDNRQPTSPKRRSRIVAENWQADRNPSAGTAQHWNEPHAVDNTSQHLTWRAPHLRSEEMPRKLLPVTPPKVQTATKSSPRRPSNSEQEDLIRLVSQIEEIEFPNESRRTSIATVQELQVPFGRDAFDATNETLPSAPSPDDLFTDRRTSTTTRQTAQQPQTDADELFPRGSSDEPDLGVLNFDDPPAAPSVNGARSRFQDDNPVVFPDSEIIPPFATDDPTEALEFDESPTTQAEPLPEPPGLNLPPNFQAEAFRSLDENGNDQSAVEDLPKSELGDFNGRDCEAENAKCDTNQAILRQIERSRVSVDISPSILPLEYDMAKVFEAREEKLAGAPSRKWRDRNGRLLAEGHLTDFRNTRIHVKTLDGTVRELVPRELSNDDWCFVTAWWDIPAECRFENESYAMRDFRLSTLTWTAAGTCHKPLYFEEVYLERSGHSAGPIVQPFISGAHFFGNIAMLPYHVGLNPPNECVYTLGHYQPGDCAPWFVGGFPMSTRGIRWEGLAWGAAIALLP